MILNIPVVLSCEEIHAIEQMLEFCDQQMGRAHQGYYSSNQGWCGMNVEAALKKMQVAQAQEKHKEEVRLQSIKTYWGQP